MTLSDEDGLIRVTSDVECGASLLFKCVSQLYM